MALITGIAIVHTTGMPVVYSFELGMPQPTVYAWIKKGTLDARQTWIGNRSFWIIKADENEISRVQALRKQPRQWAKHINTFQEEDKR